MSVKMLDGQLREEEKLNCSKKKKSDVWREKLNYVDRNVFEWRKKIVERYQQS